MEDIKIIIDTNAQDAGKSFDDLGKSFKDTTNDAEDLRKQIKGLKDELYKLTPGTEEYGRVLQELGGKMDQLSDTSQELKVATGGLDAVFQSTTSATATMAAGFTAASGVVALFGGDTEDLQKTFVKLQAVMAIMTGLKGFASFGKVTKQASTSLKAYIAQMKLARTATMQQTTSTAALTTAEGAATVATTGLGTAFKALTAAIAANPIGMLLIALTSLVAIGSKVASSMKEMSEAQNEFDKVVNEGTNVSKTFTEQLNEELANMNSRYDRYKVLGMLEHEVNAQHKKDLEDLSVAIENEKKALEDRGKELENKSGWYKYWNGPAIKKELNEITDALKELGDVAEKVDGELSTLSIRELPSTMRGVNDELTSLSNEFRIKIAGGIATQSDYLKAQINVYKKAEAELYTMRGRSRVYTGSTAEERRESQIMATQFRAKIEALETDLAAYNAGLQKKANDAAKTAAEQLNKNYKKLTDDINEKAIEYKETWKKILEQFQNLGALTDGDELSVNESIGRTFTEMVRYSGNIDKYLEEWQKTADKALRAGEITQAKYDEFKKFLENIKKDLNTSLLSDINHELNEAVLEAGKGIQFEMENFKKDNEDMLTALSGGLITKEEYQQFLEARIKDYQAIIGPKVKEAMELIDQEVAKAAPEDQGRLREIMTAYIQSADDIIPPSVMNQITSSLKEMIDKQFNTLETEYQMRLDSFSKFWEDNTRSWLEGGTDTSYWGDSASTTYKKMQQQADDLYKLLHQEYEQEIKLLEEKISVLDQNSQAYADYYQKILELRQADMDAQAAYQTTSLANIRQYSQDVMETAGKFGDAISGLASAMGSYYGEQAEQAKEMYGENSEEYKKYLKKEGNMKIAQVWTDAATGIMTAWATSEQLGPIAGPILAAVQTAALLATATASTMQIKRQTNANASGGETTANVGQLTDRVIMAEAQNTDQTAQLNADYNQGATRVFVTVDDINSGQDANRTAVTNNRF